MELFPLGKNSAIEELKNTSVFLPTSLMVGCNWQNSLERPRSVQFALTLALGIRTRCALATRPTRLLCSLALQHGVVLVLAGYHIAGWIGLRLAVATKTRGGTSRVEPAIRRQHAHCLVVFGLLFSSARHLERAALDFAALLLLRARWQRRRSFEAEVEVGRRRCFRLLVLFRT